jgi:hypothetical protein
MSDQFERDIEEIMKRLGEPAPRESARQRGRRLVGGWMGGVWRTVVSRVPRISARQVKLASLGVALLVAAGLFFGLVYPGPLLAGGGSGDSEAGHGSVAEQAGEGAGIGGILQDDSNDEASGTEGVEDREEADHEHDDDNGGRGDSDGGHAEEHHD